MLAPAPTETNPEFASMDIFEKSREALAGIAQKEAELVAGQLNPATFKPFGAPLGVYEQKDGLFMFRIRIPGGHLETSKLAAIARIAKENGAAYAHITTRQDIQLHGVSAGKFHSIGQALIEAGLPWRGGGGNTFRNITASPLSGLSKSSVFDVAPFAIAISDYLLGVDKLFDLPRKYKIAVSDSDADSAGAAWHDLGFIAIKDLSDREGFQVYGGGGLGREPRQGVKLLEFIAANDVFKAALAMGLLFSDHGDRKDRNAARIRFVLKRLGENAFKKLFIDYFSKASATGAPELAPKAAAEGVRLSSGTRPLNLAFKDGVVPLASLALIAELAQASDQPFVRLSQDQSAWLPAVGEQDAKAILSKLGLAPRVESPKPLSCIGAKTCKIGVLDSQAAAARVAQALAKLEGDKAKIAALADSIRISGCPNSCSAQQTAALGFHGLKKNVGGVSKGFFKASFGGSAARFGEGDESWLVEEERIGDFAAFVAKSFLNAKGSSNFQLWTAAAAGRLVADWEKGA